MRRIVRQENEKSDAVYAGTRLENKAFTKTSLLRELRPHRYPLVHLSSHFTFQAASPLESALLLGDGAQFTLGEMLQEPKLFAGVELLALSACETGLGGKDATGKEIEGFGVLAQRQGARAVMATLWQVEDCSTAQVMVDFYRRREEKGLTKAEALRQAQLALLAGNSPTVDCAVKAPDSKPIEVAGSGVCSGRKQLDKAARNKAHPYYWAPFVLLGNWQ